jgi:hypothetical protein
MAVRAVTLKAIHIKSISEDNMTDDTKDLGIAIALLETLTTQTLPKAFEIKERVDRGERLDQWDIQFLHELSRRAEEVRPFVSRHPEYQEVYARAVHVYKQITEQALLNEKKSAPPG